MGFLSSNMIFNLLILLINVIFCSEYKKEAFILNICGLLVFKDAAGN